MSRKTRQILVTSALPYANGSIHIGHLVEYIQTDIWVRFQKLRGHDVLYVCGDDAHGTPIMLKAREAGVTPEAHIATYFAEHTADFAKYGIGFDNFYTTHSELNRELVTGIYERVKGAGQTVTKEVAQLYDPVENMFLPDRFIRGTCPNCKSPDQYGDSCEVCGKTFDPTDLIDPKSVISGATPVMKASEHVFMRLEPARERLKELFDAGLVDAGIRNKLLEWFEKEEVQADGTRVKVQQPLRDWDITRDAPFFGFPVPGEEKKYFYNWFDAPIGYLASLGNKLGVGAAEAEAYWNEPGLEIYHFIGKDIQYFHAMFWPAILMAAGLRVPTRLAIHGFLTVNGKKMSKRDGTFIKASTFAKHMDPQWLRYYYATKLVAQPEDLDLSVDDFVARVNSELVGKLANLISRAATMVNKLGNQVGVPAMDALEVLNELRAVEPAIAAAYEERNFASATRQICALADKVNKYFDDQAPWKLVKTDVDSALGVLTAALEAGRILTIYLKPILPEFAAKVERCLGIEAQGWRDVQAAMEPHAIRAYERLVDRIDMKQVIAMMDESKEEAAPKVGATGGGADVTPLPKAEAGEVPAGAVPPGNVAAVASAAPVPAAGGEEPLAATINIDQFMAVDLRVGLVLSAEAVAGTDKMMKVVMDVGPLGTRTIYAGIQKAYTPERLNGRLVIFCANLAPRKMKFGTSEGMICASGPGGAEVFVLSPDAGAKPGQRVH